MVEVSVNSISSEHQSKIVEIIAVAQKRFGLFGLNKTSMREIAEEVGLSKASLYYYFADKSDLYRAVVEKEHKELIRVINENILVINDPGQMLIEFVQVRTSYFRTMLNLNQLKLEDYKFLEAFKSKIWLQFQQNEIEIVQMILQKGIDKQIFHVSELNETVLLFLDVLRGLRRNVITAKGKYAINDIEYEQLAGKSKLFTTIFIQGITK